MKMTLLDMTQNILSSMNSDEVNSIGDTVESRQVAEVIKTCYFNIITRANLPEHRKLFQLEASAVMEQPTLMYRPEHVRRIEWVKYNKSEFEDWEDSAETQYEYITILPLEQFLSIVHALNFEDENVEKFTLTANDNTYDFYFNNDRWPTYCTIIQDYYIIFDAYNAEFEDTLQEDRSLGYGLVGPNFEMTDTFIPELDEMQFPLLLNEAKSLAFLEIKQTQHDLAILESRRQWRNLQHAKHLKKRDYFNELPNYGRKR